jgi:hypothetical protein
MRTLLAVTLACATIDCGGSTTAPAIAFTAPHAAVTDAAGDALADARVPVAPDLVEATADVAASSITFMVRLRPGTLDRTTTWISILLDTDQNPATGVGEPGGLGADYGIDMAVGTGLATVTKADVAACANHQSCFNPAGSAALTFPPDAVQVTVPLALLGNDDGRMNFRVDSYAFAAPRTPIIFDYLPDAALAAARVQ